MRTEPRNLFVLLEIRCKFTMDRIDFLAGGDLSVCFCLRLENRVEQPELKTVHQGNVNNIYGCRDANR